MSLKDFFRKRLARLGSINPIDMGVLLPANASDYRKAETFKEIEARSILVNKMLEKY